MALQTGIVADDLTGAILVASSLEEQGIRCPVVTAPEHVPDAPADPALVVAGRFRLAPPAQAVSYFEAACRALRGAGARHLFYKYCATFDSTDEGNIGPCADALMRLSGSESLGFCTAFPTRDVTVYQGHIFLGAQLLSNSPKRFDPVTPMPDPDLVAVLQRQTARPVGLVPHSVLARGEAATRSFLESAADKGVRYVLFDAIGDRDVEVCARVTASWPAMTGGDALARMLPALQIADRAAPRQCPPAPDGATAVLAGSCGEATLEQLAIFGSRHPVLRIDLADVARDFDGVVAESLAWARDKLAGSPVALAISDTPDRVAAIQARLGRETVARLGERFCAALGAGLKNAGVRRLVVAGGETSGAVAEALRIRRFDVFPRDGLPGGVCCSGGPEPMSFFFKAGKMGHPTLFNDLMEIMAEHDDTTIRI